MASWNDKQYNSQLGQCPVCLCKLAHKKLQKHTIDCYESKKPQMESLGVIQCPFVPYHVLPIVFLNHHLDGNCQGVLNHLRKFYQKDKLFTHFKEAPDDFNPGYPEKYLNRNNRNLLYMLEEDLWGEFKRENAKKAQQDNERAKQTRMATEEDPRKAAGDID